MGFTGGEENSERSTPTERRTTASCITADDADRVRGWPLGGKSEGTSWLGWLTGYLPPSWLPGTS